ncbi:MAG: hypothetical protein KDA58_05905 [Planctomycetaceae bacterium]|nr:hypothetical protein [Planctomycetaceae bacterium]
MAAYNKFDPRVDSLVVESRTVWSPEVADLSTEERAVIARAIHAQANLASQIEYERAHTGFTRTITVTAADIERIYQQSVAGG